MNKSYTLMGILDKNTLILDESIPLPAGRVKVTIEALPVATSASSFITKLTALHQMLSDSGHKPRTKEEIDTQIQTERASWDD